MKEVFGPTLVYLKPLLVKWAVIAVMFTFFSTGFLVEAMPNMLDQSKADRRAAKSNSSKSKSALTFDLSEEGSREPRPEPQKKNKPPARKAHSSFPGNGYDWGNCTWYVKNKRPDLPNNLGNAGSWAYSAQSHGIPTGSTPKIGAVGESGGHVVYIEKVNPDGTVGFSEMNFAGLGVVTHRTLPASSFHYIYWR